MCVFTDIFGAADNRFACQYLVHIEDADYENNYVGFFYIFSSCRLLLQPISAVIRTDTVNGVEITLTLTNSIILLE